MKTLLTFVLVLSLVVTLSGVGMLSGCGESAKPPTVTAVNPASGRQGDTLDINITGTYLADATEVSFGPGVTVSSFTATSDTKIVASIAIAANAALGARSVAVTTPDGTDTKTAAFTVSSPSAPSVTSISPDSGEQAESLDVTITGTNFINVSGVSLGDGVTVDSYNVDSANQISASITIAPEAVEGLRDVSVTNSAGTGTGGGIFTVTWPAALDAVIAAAEDEGTLNMMVTGAMQVELAPVAEAAINAKYGINIHINIAPGGTSGQPAIAHTLITEYEAGQKASEDAFYGAYSAIPALYQADALKTYNWKELFPYIPDELIELDGTSIEETTTFFGFTYNTDEISEAEAPHNLGDVLGKGWDIASTTYAAGFDVLASLPNWGYENAKEFVQDLSKQLTGLIGCNSAERIASGEFNIMVFACNSFRGFRQLQPEGAPIGYGMFDDAAFMGHEYLGIPKNSEHPNLAALFTGFLLSPEGQHILDTTVYKSHHTVEGTWNYDLYNELVARGVQVADRTAQYMADNAEQLDAWRVEFMGILAAG